MRIIIGLISAILMATILSAEPDSNVLKAQVILLQAQLKATQAEYVACQATLQYSQRPKAEDIQKLADDIGKIVGCSVNELDLSTVPPVCKK